MTTRKQYSKKFNLDSVCLVTEQNHIRTEADRRLEFNAILLTHLISCQIQMTRILE